NVATVHDYRDVLFGGHAPEPDDHLLEDCRIRCGRTRRTSASPLMATLTASASSTKMERSFSPTTLLRSSSTTSSKAEAGKTAWRNPSRPQTLLTLLPSTTESNCMKRPWVLSTSAS